MYTSAREINRSMEEKKIINTRRSRTGASVMRGGAPTIGSTRTAQRSSRQRRRKKSSSWNTWMAATILLVTSAHQTRAQDDCISLADSTECSAFSAASVSTASDVADLFPFLSTVTDAESFDSKLQEYVAGDFVQLLYDELIGCSNFSVDNSEDFYARYTTSVLCNSIVQNSITLCDLTGEAKRPLCAESCATYAESEQLITESDVCGTSGANALSQIRADFTNCALPSDSLTDECIPAAKNEPDNCGYADNLSSLCSFCADSTQNSTDSCCVFSNTTEKCKGVVLPVVASSSLLPVTLTATVTQGESDATGGAAVGGSSSGQASGLTGGQIAGIVVGAVLGALLLLALIIGGCLLLRKRRDRSPATSVFNQPTIIRPSAQQMVYNDGTGDRERAGLATLPGGRVARMAALEDSSDDRDNGYGIRGHHKSSLEEGDTPESSGEGAASRPPKGSSSLSSTSRMGVLAGANDTSPSSDNDFTSPESQGQSEQLGFFKDYYSQDEIHPGDLVSTLWAYEPRAADEFALERGDMVKVLGIWDDGWATGVRVRSRAEDWRPKTSLQRDSGMSNGTEQRAEQTDGDGEVKAFPLVCVCVPQHWRKTIEGESTEGSGPPGRPE